MTTHKLLIALMEDNVRLRVTLQDALCNTTTLQNTIAESRTPLETEKICAELHEVCDSMRGGLCADGEFDI